MEETILLLLSFICVSCWCQAVVHHLDHPVASSSLCDIQRPFETSLVKAYLEQPVSVFGCSSNVLTSSGAEVHVILYRSRKKKQTVELILQNEENKGTMPPFFIYLSSNTEVTWRVHMKGDPVPGSHKFEINRKSRMKFVKKRLKSSRFVTHRKENILPNERASLITQISQKHQDIITSFSELEGGSTITLTVGKASSTDLDTSCGHLDRQQNVNLSISAVDQIQNQVEGCLVSRRDTRQNLYKGMRKAYVVELKDVPSDGKMEVNLELKRHSGHVVDEDFWLVLKSPNIISWRVSTRKLKGSINIAANSYVDMSDIRMEPVAIRSEELRDSGKELLRWIEHYLGPVAMYTAMNNSNLIKITLPEVLPVIEEPTKPNPKHLPIAQIKYNLRRSIQTECDANNLLVALGKNVLQALNIKSNALSLIDPECKAKENSSHVYIMTSPDGCGTNYMDTQRGLMTYVNRLVVHSTNTIEEKSKSLNSDEMLENEGSGFDIFSGSGVQEANDLVLDDEDLNLKPMQLSVTCSFKSQPPHEIPIFELALFHSEMYLSPYARYPVHIPLPNIRLYLQAAIVSSAHLRAHIEHCWLSHHTDNDSPRHALVKNSCETDSSVVWHSIPNNSGTQPQSERMSFTLENYVTQEPSLEIYVMCEMSVCCLDGFCHSSVYPHCETRTSDCNPKQHRLADPPHRVVIIGPISLPQQETKDNRDATVTDESVIKINPSHSDAGSSKDKQDQVIFEGLDSGTVVGIAFAAFIIGVLMMGALWFIHTHSGSIFTSGPFKRSQGSRGSNDNEGETTPGSSVPISA